MKFIEMNYGTGNVVLADGLRSIGVYPISKNHIVAMLGSNLGYGDPKTSVNFFRSDCNGKLNIIKQHNVDIVLARSKIKCEFLKEVYDEGINVYVIKDG